MNAIAIPQDSDSQTRQALLTHGWVRSQKMVVGSMGVISQAGPMTTLLIDGARAWRQDVTSIADGQTTNERVFTLVRGYTLLSIHCQYLPDHLAVLSSCQSIVNDIQVVSAAPARPSSGPTNPVTSTAPGPSPTSSTVALQSQLLQLADLPGQWQPNNEPAFTGAVTPPCLRPAVAPFQSTNVAFMSTDSSQAIGEGLTLLASPNSAVTSFTTLTAQIDKCHTVNEQNPDGTQSPLRGTLSRQPIAAIGDQSTAWHLTILNGSSTIGSGEYLLARHGNTLMFLGYLNQGSDPIPNLPGIAATAIAKLRN